MFTTWLEHHAKPYKKTWADDEGMFNKHLHSWKIHKISDIRRMDVVTLHARIGSKSAVLPNRVVELLSSMFNKAIEWGWEGENPATKIKAFREKKRERFLQPEELPAFFEALNKELNQTIRDYILIALLTGARRANVQAMRWEEINWQSGTWRIEETKSGEAVTVALARPAWPFWKTAKPRQRRNGYSPVKAGPATWLSPRARANPQERDRRSDKELAKSKCREE